MKKIIVTLFATALLSGCGLYNKYERPAVNTKGIVRDTISASDTLAVADTASFGNLPWRSVFTDARLQGYIETALHRNADLLNAALTVQMAEAQLKAAKLAFLPSFSFSPQGTIASWDKSAAVQTYSLPIAASWSVDLFGNLLSQKRSAQVALIASRDYQMAVQSNLVAGVANTYYTLLMLDEQLKVLTNMEQLTKETWDIMKIQKDLSRGVRSTAVQRAEANYYAVLSQKVDMQRQIRETENAFSLLLMQPVQAIERGTLADQQLPESFSTGVSLSLLKNRPDVHAAEMKLAQCFYNVQTARSRFYPSLTINASGAFTNSGGMGVVNPGKLLLSAVGSLVQPIFARGQIVAGLKVAKAQYEQAFNTWQNTVFKAGNEVSNALVKYNSAGQKSNLEARQIAVLEKNVEDTKALLSSAGSTYLEVITAQQSLLNVQLSKITDDFNKMQAVVSLYSALGGGTR